MKSFSLHRNYATIAVTILFVVFIGVVYFLIYIPQNEERLRQQRFLSLQNIDRNIHEKIDNSLGLIDNLLQNETSVAYLRHLQATASHHFRLTYSTKKESGPLAIGRVTDSAARVSIHDSAKQIKLSVFKRGSAGSDTITITYSFAQFFNKLLPKNVFEEYVVFHGEKPIYTTARSGLAHLRDTILNQTKADPYGVKTCQLDGIEYKLFLHPISPVSGEEITVAGLVSNNRYQNERKKLPVEIVLLLITILLAMIIAFPLIKLYHMGNKDRLKLTDAVAVIVSSMLLMSFLFFAFFKYNRPLRPNANETDPKDHVANQLAGALQQELDSAYWHLRTIDSLVSLDPSLLKDVNSRTPLQPAPAVASTDTTKQPDSAALNALRQWRTDSSIRMLLWLDEYGREKANWTWDSLNAPHGNYEGRGYFRFIKEGQPYYLNDNAGQPYYLDQVVSRVDGRFTSVVSIPSKVPRVAVAALAFRLQSFHQPLFTPGYQFAVIDRSGKVLYHSDPDRNLNEDFLTEISEQKKLRSVLEARVKDAFPARYFGRSYNILVKPVDHLPYSIIVFSDLGYIETREMSIYSFTISMFLLLCLFFVVQLLTVFLVSAKRSFFKKQSYNTSWVAPKISSHHQYNLATLANILIILLAVLFFRSSTFLTYVFILLFSVTFISFLLNAVFAKAYHQQMKKDKANRLEHHKNLGFKRSAMRSLLVLMIATQVLAFFVLDWSSIGTLLLYEALAIGIGAGVYFFGHRLLKKAKKKFAKSIRYHWNYSRSFALMAMTRLIITSGLPVVFFYLSAYNYEQNINVRYRQLQYANQLLNRVDSASLVMLANGQPVKGIYNDSIWIHKFELVRDTAKSAPSKEDNLTARILDGFRFNFTDIAVNGDKFSAPFATDTSFFYNPLLKIACKDTNATTTYRRMHLAPPYKYLSLTSVGLNYRLPRLWQFDGYPKGLAFWLALLAALTGFYFIVHNILSKLFCLRLPDLSLYRALDEKIMSDQHTNNLLFIMGLPGAGKLSRIKEKIAAGEIKYTDHEGKECPLIYDKTDVTKGNVCVVDLLTIPDSGEEKERDAWNESISKYITDQYKLIIVNHFEYNIQDSVTNRIKLNFLERLMLLNKAKIIILSTIHPVAFLDSVTEQAPGEKAVPGQDLERWHVLFGHFRMVILPLRKEADDKPGRTTIIPALARESEETHFLSKIRGGLFDVSNELIEKEGITERDRFYKADELIFTLQISSHYFYMYIWQSLTKEEKFLLYDLAEDNLVNSFDDYNLNLLIAKGVVKRRNGTLTLFNKGFRNFILTAIGNSEAMKIKNHIKDNGKWGSLRTPLMIMMMAILLFLLASEEEAYSRLLTYVAALGAGIPAVLKLFSLFDKGSQKE